MPTNEAGLSGGEDQGDGGRTTASDMPGGEKNAGVSGQASHKQSQQDFADGGHLGPAGDPVEGSSDPAATGQGPAQGEGS